MEGNPRLLLHHCQKQTAIGLIEFAGERPGQSGISKAPSNNGTVRIVLALSAWAIADKALRAPSFMLTATGL